VSTRRIHLLGVSQQIEGQTWQGTGLLRIGREPQSEVRLEDSSVSRCHAELVCREPQGWFVRDLHSTNGSALNDSTLGPEERQIQQGDMLRIGNLELRVAHIERAETDTLESFCGTLQVEATARHSWEESFEVAARDMARHSCSSTQLLGLLRTGHELHRDNSMDAFLQRSLDDAVRTLKASRGALVLLDEQSGELTLQATTPDSGTKSTTRRFSKSLAQRCLARGESLLSLDIRDDLRGGDSVPESGMRSVLCALLRSPERRLGILHFDRGVKDKPFDVVDLHLADAIAASIAGSIENARFFIAKQRGWFIRMVIALAQTIELRDPLTAGHAERVTQYALHLADAMGLPAQERRQIDTGSRLHDIGKIGISDCVLRKEGRLSHEEFEHMKSHTVKGAAILATIPELATVLPIVRNHHERWDGRGYPDSLSAGQIPLAARIVAVADAFDAMTSDRPYRTSLPLQEAFERIHRGAGAQFDPECSRAFLDLKSQMAGLARNRQSVEAEALVELATTVSQNVEAECVIL